MTSHFPKSFCNCHLRFLFYCRELCPQVRLVTHTPFIPRKYTSILFPTSPLPECFNLSSLLYSKCHTWSFLLAFCLCLSSILLGYLIASLHQCKHSCFFKVYLLLETSPIFLNLIFFFCLNSHRTKILYWNIQSSTPVKIQCIIFKSLPSSGTAER